MAQLYVFRSRVNLPIVFHIPLDMKGVKDMKGERQKPPNIHQHIINFIFPRQVDGSDWLHKTYLQIIMFIGLDIEHQQCITTRTTRLSRTPSGRPAARPQSPRAISQVREKTLRPHGIRFYAHSTEVPKRGSHLLSHRVRGDQRRLSQ